MTEYPLLPIPYPEIGKFQQAVHQANQVLDTAIQVFQGNATARAESIQVLKQAELLTRNIQAPEQA